MTDGQPHTHQAHQGVSRDTDPVSLNHWGHGGSANGGPGWDIHRHLGQLEGRMEGLEERQTRFEMRTDSSLGELNGKMDQVVEALADRAGEKKANWRAISLAGTIVSIVLGLVTWAISEFLSVEIDDTADTPPAVEEIIESLEENRGTR